MQVKAKFICASVMVTKDYDAVTFSAVYSTDPKSPNYTWSKYTPSGELRMTITNEAVRGVFKPGSEYLLSFEEA